MTPCGNGHMAAKPSGTGTSMGKPNTRARGDKEGQTGKLFNRHFAAWIHGVPLYLFTCFLTVPNFAPALALNRYIAVSKPFAKCRWALVRAGEVHRWWQPLRQGRRCELELVLSASSVVRAQDLGKAEAETDGELLRQFREFWVCVRGWA